MVNNILYTIDPNTMVLGLLFVIFYVLVNFSLSKVFRKERASSAIISICITLLAVYGINRTNFDVAGLFSNIGLNGDLIYTVVPWVILGLAILGSFAKDKTTGKRGFRLYKLLFILGALFIMASLVPGLVYEKGVVMIIGIALILIGLFLWWLRNKKKGTPSTPGNTNGRDALIRAAKQFHDWAKGQSNPKFVGNWTNFINYLKKGGWGNSEAEICQKLNINQSEFVSIFNKYGLV